MEVERELEGRRVCLVGRKVERVEDEEEVRGELGCGAGGGWDVEGGWCREGRWRSGARCRIGEAEGREGAEGVADEEGEVGVCGGGKGERGGEACRGKAGAGSGDMSDWVVGRGPERGGEVNVVGVVEGEHRGVLRAGGVGMGRGGGARLGEEWLGGREVIINRRGGGDEEVWGLGRMDEVGWGVVLEFQGGAVGAGGVGVEAALVGTRTAGPIGRAVVAVRVLR